jgi:formate hydrogenlyase subunit 6/NADH:ubiquinone oxidoreductase subunit I
MIIGSLVRVASNIKRRPATLEFPENREAITDNYRGIHKLDMNTCIECSACARICPNQTIVMVEVDVPSKPSGKGIMPEINLERCLFCALCEEVCPTKCLVLTKDYDFEKFDRRDFIKRPEDLE